MKNKVLVLKILFLSLIDYLPVKAQISAPVEAFPLMNVRLLDSPFKHAEDLDIQYLLALEPNRLLAPYLREAGLTPKAESYPNWENTGLDGHIGGHYVSALSLMYAATGNQEIKARLDYMLSEWKRCQDSAGNGYIGGVPGSKALWEAISRGEIKASPFELNKKWVPLYNIHKVYAGLCDAWLYTGNEEAKEMLIKMTDWAIQLVSKLSDEQIQELLKSEHGGLNEVFANVAAITGDEKYLQLAHKFSHQFILQPLLNKEDKLTGMHANTQIPKIIGFKCIADIEGNQSWSEAARFFWDTVVNRRSVCFGGNSVQEHFNPVDDFSKVIESEQGPETCNTYNMLKLTKQLYLTSKDDKYIEYYERALYNHILSTENPRVGGFVYFTPVRPGHYRVYSQPQTSFWCCVGSGMENQAKYGEMIYAHTDKELYVNLFIPSRLNWTEMKTEVIQETTFPNEENIRLIINPEKRKTFILQLRYPQWVAAGAFQVIINGRNQNITAQPGEYVSIERKWKKGDVVEIKVPMQTTVEQLPDKSNYYSILHGPIVLAAKTDGPQQEGLFADDSRGGHIAKGPKVPLNNLPMIVSDSDKIASLVQPVPGKPMTFTLSNLYQANKNETMELVPFFCIYESRYIIYWQQATTKGFKDILQRTEQKELERIKSDAITVDKVTCGEQQPESDHFIQSENSSIGIIENVHWRQAKGWFSYRFKNVGNESLSSISIIFRDWDQNCKFEVWVNGVKLDDITQTSNTSGKESGSTLYSLPGELKQQKELTVKFVALPGYITPKIVEVRLLKPGN